MLQPEDRTAPSRGPRHAAGGASHAFRFAVASNTSDTARHRRPQSLADVVRPRIAPPMPRRKGERGRHAAPSHDLAITVRPLPAVRDVVDVVVEGLPAAKRMAGAVREWALYTGDRPPATGSHRAPGTLPIESWLLVGKTRQQALLASLVAVGLLLILPIQQRESGVSPVSSAERAAAAIAGKGVKATAPTGGPKHSAPGANPQTPAKPSTPAAKPSASASTPTDTVPVGAGPGNSLRTTGTDAVALTFDDGPDPVQTPKILAVLAEHDVKATFCLVGEQVQKHPEIVQMIVAAGHTLCNHTWNHSLVIGKEKPEEIQADLRRTNDAIHAAVPGTPIPFFRAPGGNFTDRLVKVARGDGMTSLYWQVDPRDWDHPAEENDAKHVTKVVNSVKKFVQPGSIVLSHDFNQPDTIKAYEQLLPWLTKHFELGLPPEEVPSVTPSSPPTSPPASLEAPPAAVAPTAEPGT